MSTPYSKSFNANSKRIQSGMSHCSLLTPLAPTARLAQPGPIIHTNFCRQPVMVIWVVKRLY